MSDVTRTWTSCSDLRRRNSTVVGSNGLDFSKSVREAMISRVASSLLRLVEG